MHIYTFNNIYLKICVLYKIFILPSLIYDKSTSYCDEMFFFQYPLDRAFQE